MSVTPLAETLTSEVATTPKSKYINLCNTALHMWRQQGVEYELPPWWMIGGKG